VHNSGQSEHPNPAKVNTFRKAFSIVEYKGKN